MCSENRIIRAARRMGSVVALLCSSGISYAGHVPEIVVFGQGSYSDRNFRIDAADVDPGVADSNALMARVPGGGNNYNGALSGQLQYRGLFGPRVGTTVDGAPIQAGGPNWMDSPLHYAPAGLVERFAFSRGLASISSGPGIGGSAAATLRRSTFSDGGLTVGGDLALSGHTADSGYNASGFAAVANERQRGHVLLARDDGDDTRFGGGTIKDSAYERDFYGVGYGVRAGRHELAIDYHHVDTGPSGNPVLPLDLKFFDTDIVKARYAVLAGGITFEARAYYVDIAHRMDNFSQRRTPDFSGLPLPAFVGTDERFVDAQGETVGFALEATYDALGGTVRTGFDGRLDENAATVGDPDVPMFFVENFDNAQTDVWSVFGEWQGALSDRFTLELGARWIRTEHDSDAVEAQPAQFADANPMLCAPGGMPLPPPCAVRALRDRFNASDRSRSEDEVDWLARLGWHLGDGLDAELGLARKTRAPSYIERYLWIPLEVNAGLGDGNNYVGDVDLDPEVAHKIELGLDWRKARFYLAPRLYYHRIDDYIQGAAVPVNAFTMPVIGVSGNANGDATPLVFSNVDAELYGFDLLAGIDLPGDWHSDLSFAWVRGKRRDVDDDLFRIAPPTLRWALVREHRLGFLRLESVFTARQSHVSQALTNDPGNPNNSNAATPGYIVLNLRGQVRLEQGWRLLFGIENLLDKDYRDHLAGFNRVSGSDVAIGERLPGRGINGYLTLGYAW